MSGKKTNENTLFGGDILLLWFHVDSIDLMGAQLFSVKMKIKSVWI